MHVARPVVIDRIEKLGSAEGIVVEQTSLVSYGQWDQELGRKRANEQAGFIQAGEVVGCLPNA